MTIFCVGGVSGSGKTTLIDQDPLLQRLWCRDVSEYYEAAEDAGKRINWQQAFRFLLEDVETFLQRNYNDDIVLEAFFKPGSLQREWILDLAHDYDQEVLFLWCHASRQQCYERVYHQWNCNDTQKRRQARLRFIEEVDGRWFCGVKGEEPEQVLNRYERGFYG